MNWESTGSDLEARLRQIHIKVKRNFVFKRDIGLEEWNMPPENYNGLQTLRDDCDGFCLACRLLLRQDGISNRLVYCEVKERGRSFGHLVVEVQGWILCNLQANVVANDQLFRYRWLRISGYEPGEPWRAIIA
ncbi:MAG: hypothetical protein GKR91_11305 [Pseudomonadales bacterium]|nr:hypothetical protein [Pseudomonadales bacterium]